MELFRFIFFLYFEKWMFLATGLKDFLYFQKRNFLTTRLETFLYFRCELAKTEKTNKKLALKKFLVFLVHSFKSG